MSEEDRPFALCCDVGADAWPDGCPEHGEDNRIYADCPTPPVTDTEAGRDA